MMRKSVMMISVCLFLLAAAACEQIPSYVIRPEPMTEILVDIHKSEAVSENIRIYGTADGKEALRNSILKKHDITQEQFDTSLTWYSRHMKKYSKVYEDVAGRLKEEANEVKDLLVEKKKAPISSPGDSVNIWNKEPFFLFEPRKNRHILTFDISTDDNYRDDDVYVFTAKFDKLPADIPENARVTLIIKHRNDSVAVVSSDIPHDGMVRLETQAKKARVSRILGSIEVPPYPMWQSAYIDDISLLRIRYKHRPNLPKS